MRFLTSVDESMISTRLELAWKGRIRSKFGDNSILLCPGLDITRNSSSLRSNRPDWNMRRMRLPERSNKENHGGEPASVGVGHSGSSHCSRPSIKSSPITNLNVCPGCWLRSCRIKDHVPSAMSRNASMSQTFTLNFDPKTVLTPR